MTRRPPVHLVPIRGDAPDSAVLRKLSRRLRKALGVRVALAEPLELPPGAANDRGQLSSNAIVDALIARDATNPEPDRRWVLAVTNRDLAAPDRDFVFGEAAFGGAWALISSARLGPPDDATDRPLDRLVKEAIHELGHLASLEHCRRPRCVMHPSTSTLEIDRKESNFCEDCHARFRRRANS